MYLFNSFSVELVLSFAQQSWCDSRENAPMDAKAREYGERLSICLPMV
jgi:hypothetical protein